MLDRPKFRGLTLYAWIALGALPVQTAKAQFVQQGDKLVGTSATGFFVQQGFSLALAADGNTAIVGGVFDNNQVGAAWAFARADGVWSQQGGKLVATNAVGFEDLGQSVALSADGNTAIVGGNLDDNGTGAAWVFARTDGVWTRQAGKLVGTGAVGAAQQGACVAISGDGNTAMVSGPYDSNKVGAVWVFTQTGGVWSQQGGKLDGANAVGSSFQCHAALSSDGNTAIVSGVTDNLGIGAVWVYTRSGGIWTQQGNKLVGTGGVGPYLNPGWSVALSADGNTALVGGDRDNSFVGAAWVFTRNGSVWSQQGASSSQATQSEVPTKAARSQYPPTATQQS